MPLRLNLLFGDHYHMCSRSGSTCTFNSSTDRRRKRLCRAGKAAGGYRNALMAVIKILQ